VGLAVAGCAVGDLRGRFNGQMGGGLPEPVLRCLLNDQLYREDRVRLLVHVRVPALLRIEVLGTQP